MLSAILACVVGVSQAQTYPGTANGNCYSQKLAFDPRRIYVPLNSTDLWPDPTLYDFVVESGFTNFKVTPDNKIVLSMTSPVATVLATTRYLSYGHISSNLNPTTSSGLITTLITYSYATRKATDEVGALEDEADEIDWEIPGMDTSKPQYNVFTVKSTNLERTHHGGSIPGSVTAGVAHEYAIDWTPSKIDWIVDGNTMQTLVKANSFSVLNSIPDGSNWFPTMPSRVKFSLWQPSGTWAGSPPDYSKGPFEATFDYIQIQCYDNTGNPVQKWPADSPEPRSAPAASSTTASASASTANSSPTSAPSSSSGGSSQVSPNTPSGSSQSLPGSQTQVSFSGALNLKVSRVSLLALSLWAMAFVV